MGKILRTIETIVFILFAVGLILGILTAGGSAEISVPLMLPAVFFVILKKLFEDAKKK